MGGVLVMGRVLAVWVVLVWLAPVLAAEPAPVQMRAEVADLLFVPADADGPVEATGEPGDRLLAALRVVLPEGTTVRLTGDGTLEVSGTAEAVARAERFVAEARQRRAVRISVETRLVRLGAGDLARLPEGVRGRVAEAMAFPREALALPAEEVDALLASAQATDGRKTVEAPKVTVFRNQRSRMLVGEYHFFTTDHTPGGTGDQPTFEPVRTAVFVGTEIGLRANVSDDLRTLAVSAEVTVSQVARSESTPWAGGHGLLITRPEVARSLWRGNLSVTPGQWVVASLEAGEAEEGPVLLLVRATVVGPEK